MDARPDDPTQAVILAGGRGTRLMPLTAARPKPMIEFHGRPFLAYLIEQLRDQGFRRLLLLLGYLPDAIRDHFGNGRRFGVEIDYAVGPVEWETGARLRAARPVLEREFLLAYCDNYVPFSARKAIDAWRARRTRGQVTVYANDDASSRDNLRVDAEGFVTVYDKSRRAPDLKGVDIGYFLFNRSVVDLIPDGNASFEAAVYPRLVADRSLSAFVTRHRYYSVGDPARLPITEAFLARRPAVLIDRDGTLNARMPKAEYVRRWSDWRWLPGTLDALTRLRAAGFRCFVVTNQAGLARGALSRADLDDIHARMREEAEAAGGRIDAVYFCPHGWDEGCACRKPKPGMLHAAQREQHLDLSRTPFVGDDERDGGAAAAAGAPFLRCDPELGLAQVVDGVLTRAWDRDTRQALSGAASHA